MADQHDMVLADQAGSAFLADLNLALMALVKLSDGATEPSTTYAGMLWYDTANAVVKQRNAANSGWVTRWTVTSAEGVFTGLVDISGASAGQIKFPATQNASSDANTLDDYEEGTFTPTILLGGTPVTSYLVQVGSYTKVGNRVMFSLFARVNVQGAGSGAVTLGGLPFTSNSTTSNDAALAVWCAGLLGMTTESMMAQLQANSVAVALYTFATGTTTALQSGNSQASAQFKVSGHYYI